MAADEDVWEFARQFARTSGDSPACQCVSCRAYRAVQTSDIPSAKPTPQPGGAR